MNENLHELKVHPDLTQNRLYFTVAWKVTRKDLERLYTDEIFCVTDL